MSTAIQIDDEKPTPADVVDLSSQNLEYWPSELTVNLESITDLVLDHNLLMKIPDSVERYLKLMRMSVVGNDISQISPLIGKLKELEEFNLTENCLTELPENICDLPSLKSLRMMGNQLTRLPKDFGNLCRLSTLDLSENKLATLPPSISQLVCLQHLDLSSNQLKELPGSFGCLESLTNLNLAENSLTTLPSTFGQLSRLVILDMSSNSLEDLPDEFASKDSLREIYLDSNELLRLPGWFGQLPALTKMCAGDNDLYDDVLPDELGYTSPLLEHLDLSGNRISKLPNSLHMLKSLRFLDTGSTLPELERRVELLNGNIIQTLPPLFGWLSSLVELRLDENHLSELPENFGDLKSLEILDMGQDNLTSIPESFCNLSKLHTCSLAMNCITHLPDRFGCLTNLRSLRLDQNQLTSLPDSMRHLHELEYLDLFSNDFTEFPSCLFAVKSLTCLNVEGNKFKIKDIHCIHKSHSYPIKEPALADNWRGRQRFDHIHLQPTEPVSIVGGDSSDSDTDYSADSAAAHYSDLVLKKAAQKALTSWKSHTDQMTERPIYRPREADSAGSLPSSDQMSSCSDQVAVVDHDLTCEEEDWDEPTDDDPYRTPYHYQHPIVHPADKLKHKFLPADLHRPSFISMFQFNISKPAPVFDGQFDDAE